MSNNVTYINAENNVIEINYSNTSYEILVAETPITSVDDVIEYLKQEDILVEKDKIIFIH